MEKKVFYISCKDFFFIDLAKKLLDKKKWIPTYWTANEEHKDSVLRNFPEIFFEKNIFRVRGYIPKKFNNEFYLQNN